MRSAMVTSSIPISARMRELIGIDSSVAQLSPAELIHALLKAPVDYQIQEVEVAEVFEVPFRVLADPHYRGLYEWRRDKDRPSSNFPAIFYSGQTIWGLTLRITENLLEMMEIPRPS